MALSDKWTRAQLRSAVRRDLMDPTAKWWSDAELNAYIEDWQNRVQDELEFCWGTAVPFIVNSTDTTTADPTTIPLTAIATDILRVDDVRWNGRRLSPLTTEELSLLQDDWRLAAPVTSPTVIWQDDPDIVHIWPPPAIDGTLTFEYPRKLTFANDASTMSLPAWTRYSVRSYACMRAYLRRGPNMNLQKSMRRKALFLRDIAWMKSVQKAYLPGKYPRLRPGQEFESRLLQPKRVETMPLPATSIRNMDETPVGTVNGTNPTFTLTYSPYPAISLKLWVDGLLMLQQGYHYTLADNVITFTEAFIPLTGQVLFASYRYAVTA